MYINKIPDHQELGTHLDITQCDKNLTGVCIQIKKGASIENRHSHDADLAVLDAMTTTLAW